MKNKLQEIVRGIGWGVKSALFFPQTGVLDRMIGKGGRSNPISDAEYLTREFVRLVVWDSAVTAGVYYLLS